MMLGYRNVWALVNSTNVEIFPVLDGVSKLTILGEHCDANERARERCAQRWLAAGRSVTIAMPDRGKDFNDELIARALTGKQE
jgi:hypothetical protein